MNLGRLQSFLQAQRWQYGWETPGQHGLSRTRWTNENSVMSPCSRYFERSFNIFLPLYICKINFKIILRLEKFLSCINYYRLQSFLVAFKKTDHIIDMVHS